MWNLQLRIPLEGLNRYLIEWRNAEKRRGLSENKGRGIIQVRKVREQRRLTLRFIRRGDPPDERKEGLLMYVTYSDLIQIGIFIIALVGLCYTIFGGRK